MATRYLIAACLIVAASSALAEPRTVTKRELCQELVAYQPSDDVNYKAGKDVHGRDVAPPDLETTLQIDLPEEVWFRITVDQAQFLGIPYEQMPYGAVGDVGTVKVSLKDNSVYFNGKRISQPQIQVLCKDEKK